MGETSFAQRCCAHDRETNPKPDTEQVAYLDQLIQSNATVAVVFKLAQDFGHLLRKREGLGRLEQWKTAVHASGIAELIAFADGLADDAEAVPTGAV